MTTLGTVFLPDAPPERLRATALAADRTGLDELWLWEDCFKESGIASAAAALAWTERVKVAVGLLPVPLRNVALTAMEVATLHRLFPGRLRIGVGHGVQDWMGQVGARVESPMTLLAEYVTALRGLLGGERVDTAGRYVRLAQVALDWPPHTVPELLVGAVGRRTVRLAGELGDGAILAGDATPETVAAAREVVGTDREIVVYVDVAAGADAGTVAALARRYADAGADTVVLVPAPEQDPERFVEFVAGEVRDVLG